MATRSVVAYGEQERMEGFYVHWDGYPEETGRSLAEYYGSSEAAEALSDFGLFGGMREIPQPSEETGNNPGWFSEIAPTEIFFHGCEMSEEPMYQGTLEEVWESGFAADCQYFYWWDSGRNDGWRWAPMTQEVATDADMEEMQILQGSEDSRTTDTLPSEIKAAHIAKYKEFQQG